MTQEKEGFVHRWTRRAHEARRERATEPAEPPAREVGEPDFGGEELTLPPLESLHAGSDYRAFLGANVPKALRVAALRKAWTSDPTIAAHRPLVEYDWDCNAPGYGKLKPNDLTGKLARSLIRHFQPEKTPTDDIRPDVLLAEIPPESAAPAIVENSFKPIRQTSSAVEEAHDAIPSHPPCPGDESSGDLLPHTSDDARPRRRHGSARPA